MLRADDKLYVHLPKTGGLTVRRVLKAELGDRRVKSVYGTHAPWTGAPTEVRAACTLFGTVRSPWDWYVSLYFYAMEKSHLRERHPGILAYGQGKTSFRDFLFGATHIAQVKVPEVLGMIYNPPGASPKRLAEQLTRSGLGLCAWLHYYSYGNAKVPSFELDVAIATDRLFEGLVEVMGLPPEHKTWWTAQNTGIHPPAKDLYDEEMIGWVREVDSPLVEQFGFEPFCPSPQAAYRLTRAKGRSSQLDRPLAASAVGRVEASDHVGLPRVKRDTTA